jgi:hypothetical protein
LLPLLWLLLLAVVLVHVALLCVLLWGLTLPLLVLLLAVASLGAGCVA